MKKIVLFGSVLAVTPLVSFAAEEIPRVSFFTILTDINALLMQWVVPVLISLAVVYFIWGMLQYILSSADEAKKEGRGKMLNGLIGLFVIIAFWGIIALITSTFGVGPTQITEQQIPCIPGPGVICPR